MLNKLKHVSVFYSYLDSLCHLLLLWGEFQLLLRLLCLAILGGRDHAAILELERLHIDLKSGLRIYNYWGDLSQDKNIRMNYFNRSLVPYFIYAQQIQYLSIKGPINRMGISTFQTFSSSSDILHHKYALDGPTIQKTFFCIICIINEFQNSV